jgi:hypothetical protein
VSRKNREKKEVYTMKKKILSLALALCLLTAFIPVTATIATAVGQTTTILATGEYEGISYAVKEDGSLWAWGGSYISPQPIPEKIMDDVVSLGGGGAIKADGSVWLILHEDWDNGFYVEQITDSDVLVGSGIRADGSLWELKYNWENDSYTSVKIMDSVVAVAYGAGHTMAIRTDGSLWAWGVNWFGQLGDGTTEDRDAPIKIMDSVISISAGSYSSFAIKTDGSLWGWGGNDFGQLGNGNTEERHSPVKIMDSVISVSVVGGDKGYNSRVFALSTDRSLWSWGDNSKGQLGDGTTIDRSTPVKIMDGVATVSAGIRHTMALKTDGSLWAWGANESGQIGDGTVSEPHLVGWTIVFGTENDRHSPVKVMDGVKLPGGSTLPPPIFSDIATITGERLEMLEFVVERGLFQGSGGRFMPFDRITNMQFITVMSRIANPGIADGNPWYQPHLDWAAGIGISGFDRDAFLTRDDMALWFYNYIVSTGIEPGVVNADTPAFTDIGGLSADYQEAIAAMYEWGITRGTTPGTVYGLGNAERIDIAVIIGRFVRTNMP